MTFRPADRRPPRDDRVERVELVVVPVFRRGVAVRPVLARAVLDLAVLDGAVLAREVDVRDDDRPGRWLARLEEPERDRLDEPPLERRREWGTVEVIG